EEGQDEAVDLTGAGAPLIYALVFSRPGGTRRLPPLAARAGSSPAPPSPTAPLSRPRMLAKFAKRLFGSANDRFIKGLRQQVAAINALDPQLQALSDEALAARTADFRQRLAGGAELDTLLVEAFATVREAAKRT